MQPTLKRKIESTEPEAKKIKATPVQKKGGKCYCLEILNPYLIDTSSQKIIRLFFEHGVAIRNSEWFTKNYGSMQLMYVTLNKEKKKVLVIRDFFDNKGYSLINRALRDEKLPEYMKENNITGLDIQSTLCVYYDNSFYHCTNEDFNIIKERFGFIDTLYLVHTHVDHSIITRDLNLATLSIDISPCAVKDETNKYSTITSMIITKISDHANFNDYHGGNLQDMIIYCNSLQDVNNFLIHTPKIKCLTLSPQMNHTLGFDPPYHFISCIDNVMCVTTLRVSYDDDVINNPSFDSIPLTHKPIVKNFQKKSSDYLLIPKSLVYLKLDSFNLDKDSLKRLLYALSNLVDSKLKILDLSSSFIYYGQIEYEFLKNMLICNPINVEIIFKENIMEDLLKQNVPHLFNGNNLQFYKRVKCKSYQLIQSRMLNFIICLKKKKIPMTQLTNQIIFEILQITEERFINIHHYNI